MQEDKNSVSLETLSEIRNIMERSARFLSLSGWSGVWAGCTALAGAYVAYKTLTLDVLSYNYMLQPVPASDNPFCFCGSNFYKPLILAVVIFLIALAGGYYFTRQKVRRTGGTLWNPASRSMVKALALPLVAGAIFCIGFMKYGHAIYLAPACLIFYGIALFNGSRYTLSEIRYLGLCEIVLGAVCLFVPGYGLYFWAFGFGILHIVYGIAMWNKYDKAG